LKSLSNLESILNLNKIKTVEKTLNTSSGILIDCLKLNTPRHYAKASYQLLNFTTIFAIILPVVYCLLFFIVETGINSYPFITLFTAGVISHYFLQKEFTLVAAIYILFGFLFTSTILVYPAIQEFNISYLFLIIPFLSAIFLYPKKQLHLVFVSISLCLFLFTNAIDLFSSLLFSNPLNGLLLCKVAMALMLCTVVFFISNHVAYYLQNSESQKLKLESEVALRKSEIKNFSGIAAHDLREPLQTLSAYIGLLEKSLDKKESLTDAEKDFFILMDNSAKCMLSLLDDLSMFSISNIEENSKTAIDLNAVLQAVKKNLLFTISKTSARIKIEDLPVVNTNFNAMLHLFQNIVSNALKYQPKSTEHIPVINVKATLNDTYHIIYVTDNGIGIPKNKMVCIFEPLKRLHTKSDYKGTGLGLSICKSIVEKCNGKIEVSSELGEGTTFEVYLPIEK